MTTPTFGPRSGRHGLRGLLLLLLALTAMLAAAGPASAKTCGEQVIDDWFDGRIDGTYALHCYDDAIEQLPRDVRDYSSAKEDIERALQARLRGDDTSGQVPPAQTTGDDDGSGSGSGAVPPGGNDNDSGGPNGNGPGDGDSQDAIPSDAAATDDASSVPVPLLLLAGLALLLLAGGAAGYVVRRMQARRVTPPAL